MTYSDPAKHYITHCEVWVDLGEQFVLTLAGGMDAVCRFSKLADNGIPGATKVETSFACNIDVYIPGAKLIDFIAKEYPTELECAKKRITELDTEYTIVCYDIS